MDGIDSELRNRDGGDCRASLERASPDIPIAFDDVPSSALVFVS
jgi:hypothetical protein